ncbi:MAG: sugar ABC transporter permease [Bacillota bacterium]
MTQARLKGLAFASPWILGFLLFTLYPVGSAVYYSFTEFTGLGKARWVGLSNYVHMLKQDEVFWLSFYNTMYYLSLAVPIGFVIGLGLALLLNARLREISFYRTAVYLPYIIPAFAASFIWLWVLNPQFGLLNLLLDRLGIFGPGWIADPQWSKPSIVMMAQWGAGGSAIIFLAALQDVPRDLYEAAELDGATPWQRFSRITLPMISPVVLFHVIMAVFQGFQVFTPAYIMTSGGPANSTLFYVLYLYRNAFQYGRMGYASAMAWVLFLVSLVTALAILRSSARWVYYQGEQR